MKYVCLCYYDQEKFDALSESDLEALGRACRRHDQALHESGHLLLVGSLALPSSSRVLRPGNGRPSVTDGPYAQTKEPVGAFFIIEAQDMSGAVEVASKHPGAHVGDYLGGASRCGRSTRSIIQGCRRGTDDRRGQKGRHAIPFSAPVGVGAIARSAPRCAFLASLRNGQRVSPQRGGTSMSAQDLPPFALFRMVTGYYVSRAIHVAAKLGIADLLAEDPRGHEELAKATGTHADSLRRVLRLLASTGVLLEEEDGKFAVTPIGACLRSGVPGSMRAAALLFGGITQQAWGEILHSVETGEPAFARVFGMDPFDYIAAHPDEAANFDAAMADFTKHIAIAVAAAYDFSPFRRIVDVGGGNGALLAGILTENPRLTGVIFDLPNVATRATEQIRELGLAGRCEVVGGDFFKEVPGDGDAYLLKHVIHDWDDDRATEILRTCRRAMGAEAKLLIVEGVYPPRIDQSDQSRGAAANDVNMLVCTGGRQRSGAEFRRLFGAAGFRLTRIVPTQMPVKVIEGVRA
jgi:hypothetical protein